jgi:hypothetical protein
VIRNAVDEPGFLPPTVDCQGLDVAQQSKCISALRRLAVEVHLELGRARRLPAPLAILISQYACDHRWSVVAIG